jgi:hypothetical protein
MVNISDTIGLGGILLSVPTSLLAGLTWGQRRRQMAADAKAEKDRRLAAIEAKNAQERQDEIKKAVEEAVSQLRSAAQTQEIAATAQVTAADSLHEIHGLVNSEFEFMKKKVIEAEQRVAELEKRLRASDDPDFD